MITGGGRARTLSTTCWGNNPRAVTGRVRLCPCLFVDLRAQLVRVRTACVGASPEPSTHGRNRALTAHSTDEVTARVEEAIGALTDNDDLRADGTHDTELRLPSGQTTWPGTRSAKASMP